VGFLTSMPDHRHTTVIWLLCLPAVAGYRPQVHLDLKSIKVESKKQWTQWTTLFDPNATWELGW
jgi:hypothetical protein